MENQKHVKEEEERKEEGEDDNIWVAASEGDLDKIKRILSSSSNCSGMVDIKDEAGYTPLMASIAYAQMEVISHLIEQGADLHAQDEDGNTILHHVEDVEIARYLLESSNSDTREACRVLLGVCNRSMQLPVDVHLEDLNFPLVEYLNTTLRAISDVSDNKVDDVSVD